jgi:hypothetical protein
MSTTATGRRKGQTTRLLDRLERQASRTLGSMERAKRPPSIKDLNGLYRLLARIRAEREAAEQEAEVRRLNEIAGD